MLHLDVKDLELFVSVVDCGSISSGARRANLSLAAASGRIKKMELWTNTLLLTREPQGVRLTEAGRVLYEHALKVLGEFGKLNADLESFPKGQKAQIRLLANTHALSEFVPEDVGDYLRTRPHTNVSIEERSSPEIVDAINDGIADVGVVAGDFETSSLATLPYRTDRLVVVAHRNVALNPTVDFVELLDKHAFVGLNRSFAIPRFLDRHARRVGKFVRQRMQVASFDAVCSMVSKGIGIGIVPEAAARRLKPAYAFKIHALRDPWALRELRVCVRGSAKRSDPVSQLFSWLAKSGERARRDGSG